MTTYEWLSEHLHNMFTENHKKHSRGYVSNPTYYSGVGIRDRIMKSKNSFRYYLWGTCIFDAVSNAECKNKMAVSYGFYPCYDSVTTRDRLNMIADILNVPIGFNIKDVCLYADDMICDSILVYPGIGKIVYDVHGMDMDTYEKDDYQIIKIYDKKGVRWV